MSDPRSADLPSDLVANARAFIDRSDWRFAKTMPENPHWYVVRPAEPDVGHDALLALLERYGTVRHWHGHPYRSISLDGWDYWFIHPVINRKPTGRAGWDDEAKEA